MDSKNKILIVDDERNTREIMSRFLRPKYDVTLAESGEKALEKLEQNSFDLILTDLRMPGIDGMQIVQASSEQSPPPPCIMITAYGSIESAVQAVKSGAFDFVSKPVNFDQLEIVIERALSNSLLKTENRQLKKALAIKKNISCLDKIIAKSKEMQQLLDLIKQVAPTRSTVLLEGESGTGKELLAQALHELSGREGELVSVHCAALPATLLESELFGHEKGAFTGAVECRKGRFELADNGTLFLDEIGEIDPQIQVKLLRVLEARSFERLGGMESLHTNARLISATNKNLRQMVDAGEFREDLYYRLDVVSIKVPPLRRRKDDIPLLIKHFMDEFSRDNNKDIQGMDPAALELLCAHSWPGNIRELRNCLERMIVLCGGKRLGVKDIPPSIREYKVKEDISQPAVIALEDNEKNLILRALSECNENRSLAAEKLGISRRTLHRKLKSYGIESKYN